VSAPLKLFFDSTSSPKLPRLLREFYAWDYPHLEATQLYDKFSSDQNDDPVWLSALSAEGGWIVVSEDRAKSSRRSQLPLICANLKITHILVSPSLKKFADMKQAIVECWRDVVALSRMPPGTKSVLRFRSFHSEERKPILLVGDTTIAPAKKRIIHIPKPSDRGVKQAQPDFWRH
jgi:hypothetical protein